MTNERRTEKAVSKAVRTLLFGNFRIATSYITPTLRVRVARRTYKHTTTRPKSHEFVLTIGKPNFVERRFVAAAVAAGEPFPVKRVQVR